MDRLATVNIESSVELQLPKSLRKGSKFIHQSAWESEVYETALEAGFITQTIEIKAKGKISETELRMECSHEDCEWINSIKLNPKTKQWVVDNSSTLDSSSHNHLIEAIPSHHLAEAQNHLEELRAEKEKQLEELRDELETSSDVEKSAGARKTKKPRDSGVRLESEDSDRSSRPVIKSQKRKSTSRSYSRKAASPSKRKAIVLVDSSGSESEFEDEGAQKKKEIQKEKEEKDVRTGGRSMRTVPKISYTIPKKSINNLIPKEFSKKYKPGFFTQVRESKKRNYESNLPTALNKLAPKLGDYVKSFAEMGITSKADLNYIIEKYSDERLEELRKDLMKLTGTKALPTFQRINFFQAIQDRKEMESAE